MPHGERYTQPAITHLIETKPVTTAVRFVGPYGMRPANRYPKPSTKMWRDTSVTNKHKCQVRQGVIPAFHSGLPPSDFLHRWLGLGGRVMGDDKDLRHGRYWWLRQGQCHSQSYCERPTDTVNKLMPRCVRTDGYRLGDLSECFIWAMTYVEYFAGEFYTIQIIISKYQPWFYLTSL
jgi:hypothetical protein